MQIFTAILDAFYHFVRIVRTPPQTGRGAVPLFSDQTTTYCTMTCAEKTLILFFLFLLSFFAPKASVLRKRERGKAFAPPHYKSNDCARRAKN